MLKASSPVVCGGFVRFALCLSAKRIRSRLRATYPYSLGVPRSILGEEFFMQMHK